MKTYRTVFAVSYDVEAETREEAEADAWEAFLNDCEARKNRHELAAFFGTNTEELDGPPCNECTIEPTHDNEYCGECDALKDAEEGYDG